MSISPICRKCGCLSLIVFGKKTKNHCSSSDPSYLCRRKNKNRPALTKQKKIITIKKYDYEDNGINPDRNCQV